MKYGLLFLLLSGQLVCAALLFGGWFLLLFWPALCFGVVGGSYVKRGPRAFGKRDDGSMSFVSITLLLPYLGYLWTVWHTVRLVSREPAYNIVADGITIGRRLLSHERPSKTHTVVDLTCEFPEPSGMRSVAQYKAFPMLDATAASPDSLVAFVRSLSSTDDSIYIHCAGARSSRAGHRLVAGRPRPGRRRRRSRRATSGRASRGWPESSATPGTAPGRGLTATCVAQPSRLGVPRS